MKRQWYRFRKWLRPLGELLTGWIPTTVYQVTGPPGHGPWFGKPEDAAAFCTEECAMDNGWDGDIKHACITIYFLPDELEALERRTVRKIVKAGWGIERISIPRRRLVKEWDGW